MYWHCFFFSEKMVRKLQANWKCNRLNLPGYIFFSFIKKMPFSVALLYFANDASLFNILASTYGILKGILLVCNLRCCKRFSFVLIGFDSSKLQFASVFCALPKSTKKKI